MFEKYRRLLDTSRENSDVDFEEAQPMLSQHQPARSSIYHWIGHAASALLSFSLILFILFQTNEDTCHEYGLSRTYPPLENIVQYSTKTYDHVQLYSTELPSVFKGESRPELDEAWGRITNHSMILITDQDMMRLNESTENAYKYKGKYFAIVDGFHQLHCVDLIRKYIYRESYPDYIAFHDSKGMISYHVDHCLDVLRQKVMCDTDTDLVVYNKPRNAQEKPEARFAIPRKCRNFEELRQWTLDNAWDSS